MSAWSKETNSDDTHDVTTKWNDSRGDEYVSKSGDGGNHCHLWSNKDTGSSGVEHRGACKVCDDDSSSGGK